jgi:hypothetical protein
LALLLDGRAANASPPLLAGEVNRAREVPPAARTNVAVERGHGIFEPAPHAARRHPGTMKMARASVIRNNVNSITARHLADGSLTWLGPAPDLALCASRGPDPAQPGPGIGMPSAGVRAPTADLRAG